MLAILSPDLGFVLCPPHAGMLTSLRTVPRLVQSHRGTECRGRTSGSVCPSQRLSPPHCPVVFIRHYLIIKQVTLFLIAGRGVPIPPVVLPDSCALTGGVTVHEASCRPEPCMSTLPPSCREDDPDDALCTGTRPPGASGLAVLGKHRFRKFAGDLTAVPYGQVKRKCG